jgi:hypothetical protein
VSERLLVDRLAQSKWPSTPAPEGSDSTTLSVCNFHDGHGGTRPLCSPALAFSSSIPFSRCAAPAGRWLTCSPWPGVAGALLRRSWRCQWSEAACYFTEFAGQRQQPVLGTAGCAAPSNGAW